MSKKQLQEAVEKGRLSRSEARHIANRGAMTLLDRLLKHFYIEDGALVWSYRSDTHLGAIDHELEAELIAYRGMPTLDRMRAEHERTVDVLIDLVDSFEEPS